MPIITFSIVLIVVIILLISSFILFHRDRIEAAKAPIVYEGTYKDKTLYESSIGEIASRIATEDLTEVELLKVASFVANKFKFPGKQTDKDPSDHLKFISEFCMNKNVAGSGIVKMSNTFKMVNIPYKNEIEAVERDAIKERDNQAADN